METEICYKCGSTYGFYTDQHGVYCGDENCRALQPLAVSFKTREEWLLALVNSLRPHFTALNYPIPEDLLISCGWPSTRALSQKKRRIGEHWHSSRGQIFISPILLDPAEVAETVVHELGHACLPAGAGHKTPFKQFMKTIGLAGKATATYAGPELAAFLKLKTDALGDYPHSKLDKLQGPEKKQTTRMRKVQCAADHEPYVLRGAKATFDRGVPNCPVCGADMEVEEGEDEE